MASRRGRRLQVSPKEDSVTDLGHNYHHVRAAVRGGRKKKIPSPKENSATDLGHMLTVYSWLNRRLKA
jgi:hypothetical protein